MKRYVGCQFQSLVLIVFLGEKILICYGVFEKTIYIEVFVSSHRDFVCVEGMVR